MVRGEPPPIPHWQDQGAGGGLPMEQPLEVNPTPISIQGVEIEMVDACKFLGVRISRTGQRPSI